MFTTSLFVSGLLNCLEPTNENQLPLHSMVPTDPTLCQKCSIARHDQPLEYLPEEGFCFSFPQLSFFTVLCSFLRRTVTGLLFCLSAPWLVQLYDYAVLISAPSARSLPRVTPTSLGIKYHQIKNILAVTDRRGSHFCI